VSTTRIPAAPIPGGRSRLFVRVERSSAKPALPWMWVIYEEGRADAHQTSNRFYRSAEEAWSVGQAMLDRVTHPGRKSSAAAPADRPM
jgi:hypothetical protein